MFQILVQRLIYAEGPPLFKTLPTDGLHVTLRVDWQALLSRVLQPRLFIYGHIDFFLDLGAAGIPTVVTMLTFIVFVADLVGGQELLACVPVRPRGAPLTE